MKVALYAAVLRRLGQDDAAWLALDRAGIRGHGLHLLRFDFPPVTAAAPIWGYSTPSHPSIDAWIRPRADEIIARARGLLGFVPELAHLPEEATAQAPLAWRNEYQTALDIAFDYGLLRQLKFEKYVEVGSGVSTLVADAVRARGSRFHITSIDPEPRADIDRLADQVVRRPLEECVALIVELSGPGTVLFINGSHFVFPGNDVTRFFLDVLPHLPPGTVVHIHDIYLPDDYPARHLNRLWSEQYLLASWILGGGRRLEPLLPGHWLAAQLPPEVLSAPSLPAGHRRAHPILPDASCWWMTVR